MNRSEQIAKKILENEDHDIKQNPHPLMPDFECYAKHHCCKFFEIKSIGHNNSKFQINTQQLQNLTHDREVIIIVIDRRTEKEFMRFKISEIKKRDKCKTQK